MWEKQNRILQTGRLYQNVPDYRNKKIILNTSKTVKSKKKSRSFIYMNRKFCFQAY